MCWMWNPRCGHRPKASRASVRAPVGVIGGQADDSADEGAQRRLHVEVAPLTGVLEDDPTSGRSARPDRPR